jgi:hypothetical protein
MNIQRRFADHPWLRVLTIIWPAIVGLLMGPIGYAAAAMLGGNVFGFLVWIQTCGLPWTLWPLEAVSVHTLHGVALLASAGVLLNVVLVACAARILLARSERASQAVDQTAHDPLPSP